MANVSKPHYLSGDRYEWCHWHWRKSNQVDGRALSLLSSRRMMNERESAPEGIFGNDRSPCQRRKFRAPESVAVRTQFNRNSCRGCALTTRPCDGPRTVAFSPSVKMNDCYQGRSMKSGGTWRLRQNASTVSTSGAALGC